MLLAWWATPIAAIPASHDVMSQRAEGLGSSPPAARAAPASPPSRGVPVDDRDVNTSTRTPGRSSTRGEGLQESSPYRPPLTSTWVKSAVFDPTPVGRVGPPPGKTTWYGSIITSEPMRVSTSGDRLSVHSVLNPMVPLSIASSWAEDVVTVGAAPSTEVDVLEVPLPAADRSYPSVSATRSLPVTLVLRSQRRSTRWNWIPSSSFILPVDWSRDDRESKLPKTKALISSLSVRRQRTRVW